MMLDDQLLAPLESWLNESSMADWVLEAWLFGSRAKGTFRSDSDVDLAFVLRDEVDRTAEGEFCCMHQRWNNALTDLLQVRADVWWLNDPEATIVPSAVAEHGVLLWRRSS